MQKKKCVEIVIVCVLLLFLAGYLEASERNINSKNQVIRGSPGEYDQEVELQLDAGDVVKNYDYTLMVPAADVTKEEADKYFDAAKEEISKSFYAEGDDENAVTLPVNMQTSYQNGMVKAEWTLDSYRLVDVDGVIIEEAVSQNGSLEQATVQLTCGNYKQEYVFSFMVYPRVLSESEKILKGVKEAIDKDAKKEGNQLLTLPKEVNGVSLRWSEAKRHLVIKMLFFEVIVLVLLYFVRIEREKTKRKERQDQMMLDYSEVVSKLLILMGAGMSLKQSWNTISARYSDKRKKNEAPKRFIYEEMVYTNHEIQDGETELVAYQKFGERTEVGAYQRLVRILVQNVQIGSRGICQLLSREAEDAMEERKALAKRMGEEAGTKMLFPLLLMLGIVFAIIMTPALLAFQI